MDPAKLKVVELRAQLSQRGLDAKGNKPVLVERLRRALEEETSNRDQEKRTKNIENEHDTAFKENEETTTETVKPPQTPKASGRSSRSSTAMTPTKISTRSAPRTSMTPNSTKQPSPSKPQRVETSCEILPTIPESSPKGQTEKKDDRTVSSVQRSKDADEKDLSSRVPHEAVPSVETKMEGKPENLKVKDKCKNDKSISETSPEKSPKQLDESIRHSSKESEDQERQTSERIQESAISANKGGTEKEQDVAESINECNESKDEKPAVIKEVTLKEEKSELVDNVECVENVKDVEKVESLEIKEIQDSSSSAKAKVEETTADDKMEVVPEETPEETMEKVADVSCTEFDIKKEDAKEEDDSCGDKKIEQAIEATELRDEQDTALAPNDRQRDCKQGDRKRKRSPSPIEEARASPVPATTENEPEIDEAALILSWYDSDLNLVIDANGFFTATPMHSDGFSRMWAGVRASYGFFRGKVYYEAKITELCSINTQDEMHSHMLRVGWSASYTSMQLGEEKFSYGYDSTSKKATDNQFTDYGVPFGKDDVIGCYLDATSESNVVVSYAVNGKDLGTAFDISKEELGDKPLFPHILSKNCRFACNFGQEAPWSEEILSEYVSVGNADSQYKVAGPRRPEKREDCEVIMMCGLPASGKTTWAMKHAAQNPQKMFNVLGIESLIDKMKNTDLLCKENYTGPWDVLIDKCTRALEKLIEMAPSRRRNYILDQTNVYASAQRRKMKNFSGYQRKAVVVVPTEEEFKSRATKRDPIGGKKVPDSTLAEMKANFSAPMVGEHFDVVDWVEVDQEEGRKLIEGYNKEGKEAGFGQQQEQQQEQQQQRQQTNKRPRLEKPESNRENREVRNNRDAREVRDHRRSNYPDRNRNAVWRGGGNASWRDRPQRGGHIRHAGGYGPPIPWRGRGGIPVPPPHRGLDRRGGGGAVDRGRPMNDRSRGGAGNRPGGGHWGPMSGYQGSQQPVWGQQSTWSGGQSQSGGWGQQQGGWAPQQWGNWKGYGQGSYSQTNYNQQGYGGNGNWNSWNQQYYNQQYWGHQQQTGQTTAAGGGQAVSKQ